MAEQEYSSSNEKRIKVGFSAHHQRQQICKTRAPYRKGKKETAIKVFTIADESIYLLIQKVPCLPGVDVQEDLKALCSQYGNIIKLELIDHYGNNEPFANTYMVKYETIVKAIRAKKRLDDFEFLGSCLHVCYAPELESVEETLQKMNIRQRYVNVKLAQMKNLEYLHSN